jgi:DNA-directed RNA polymerase delta subunit
MKHKSVADVAYEILLRNKKPLHFRKITEELVKIKPLKVKEPYYAVNASMSGDKRFMRAKRGIWGLVKWKYKDANIKYSLTSYCIKDGTMFLTSYMRPFFPKDKKEVEVSFIDKEGNELEVIVNNEVNRIIGFKEWYRKKNLKVNDVIFIGLIDYDKRKYFIVTEDETLKEPQKEISKKIFKILENEGHPLSYKEICERALEVEVKGKNLFSQYINDILKKDPRFVEEKEELWGLFDWLDEIRKLQIQLITTKDSENFKELFLKVFNFLGYNTSFIVEKKNSFILAKALLDYKTYNLIIDSVVSDKEGKKIKKYEYWNELSKVRDKTKSDYSVIISSDFDYEKMSKKANKDKVILFKLRWINNIIEEHNRLPFSLSDLKSFFLPSNSLEKNIYQLLERRKQIYNKIKLINLIIKVLNENISKKLYSNIESLTKIINQKSKNYFELKEVKESEVEEITKTLALEPFNIVKKTEMGNIILNYKPEIAKERLIKIIEEMF